MNFFKYIKSVFVSEEKTYKLSPELISSIQDFLQLDDYDNKIYIRDLDYLIAKLDSEFGLINKYGIQLLEKKIMTFRWKSDNEANTLILCEKVENAYIRLNLLETKEHGIFLILRSEIYMDYGKLILCHNDLLKAREILSRQSNISYDDVYRYQYPIIKYYIKVGDYSNAEIECISLIDSHEEKNSNYNSDYYNLINLLVTYIYFEVMEFDKAIKRCNDAIKKLGIHGAQNHKHVIRLYMQIGMAFMEKKDYKSAVKSLKLAMDTLGIMLAIERHETNKLLYKIMYHYQIQKLIATAYYEGGFLSSAAKVLKLLLNDEYFQKHDSDVEMYKEMMNSATNSMKYLRGR